jgi:hypothetical protein
MEHSLEVVEHREAVEHQVLVVLRELRELLERVEQVV